MAIHKLTKIAKHLRRETTLVERRLWSSLRANQVEGFKFRRQVPAGRFVLDFYCHVARLAIELDGSQHGNPENEQADSDRSAELMSAGIEVLRFTNFEVTDDSDAVLETILREVRSRISRRRSALSPALPQSTGGGSALSSKSQHSPMRSR